MRKTEQLLRFDGVDGWDIQIPVVTLEGDRPGPRAVITAGIHGCEYPPILAATEFIRTTPLEEIRGTVTIVTVATVPSFEGRTPFVNPIDGKNPNRCFPGTLEGSYTDRLTWHLFHDVIEGADYHIDLHCGDMTEMLGPYCEYGVGHSPEVDEMSREMGRYSGVRTLVESDYNRDDLGLPPGLNYINSVQHGIPSAMLELGEMGRSDRAYVEGNLYFLRNVLRRFGNLDGRAVPTENQQCFAVYVEVDAPVTGIFQRCVEPGEDVEAGQKVGEMYDYFGNHICDVHCKTAGRVLYIASPISVKKDGFLMNLVY